MSISLTLLASVMLMIVGMAFAGSIVDFSGGAKLSREMRRMAVERKIACLTSVDTAKALVKSLRLGKTDADLEPLNLKEILDQGETSK